MLNIEFIGIAGSGKSTCASLLKSLFSECNKNVMLTNKYIFENNNLFIRYVWALLLLTLAIFLDVFTMVNSIYILFRLNLNIRISLNYLLQLSIGIISTKLSNSINISDQGIVQSVISLFASTNESINSHICRKLLVKKYLPRYIIKTELSDLVSYRRLENRNDRVHSRMYKSGINGQYWINYVKSLTIVEDLLSGLDIKLIRIDTNCNFEGLNLKVLDVYQLISMN